MKKTFLIGAIGYPALELAYRGRTHYSMSLAGGISAVLASQVKELPLSLPVKAGLCGAGITGIEYVCGCIWNRRFTIWDYRKVPLNWRGQICLPYSLLWSVLSAGFMLCHRTKTGQK